MKILRTLIQAARIRRHRQGDRGAISVILAGGLLVLILGVSFAMLNLGLLSEGKNELQVAADSAATMAASQLCSSRECYRTARESAIRLLARLRAQSSVGADQALDVLSLSIPENQFEWDLTGDSNLIVAVERGRFLPNRDFESMEGDEWQQNHPGIPAFLAANAVRVTIRRPWTKLFSGAFTGELFSVERSSIAIKGNAETVPVAPFALPACALLNNGGSADAEGNRHPEYYSANGMCSGDRIFTRADRFGSLLESNIPSRPGSLTHMCNDAFVSELDVPANVNRTTLDSFFGLMDWWNNSAPLYDREFARSTFRPSPSVFTSPSTEACAHVNFKNGSVFPQPSYTNTSSENGDHFGVVGIPASSPISQEELATRIRSAIAGSTNPTWSARIGDPFIVLANGLTDLSGTQAVDNNMWRAITNNNFNDPHHPHLRDTMLTTIDNVWSAFALNVDLVVPVTGQTPWAEGTFAYSPWCIHNGLEPPTYDPSCLLRSTVHPPGNKIDDSLSWTEIASGNPRFARGASPGANKGRNGLCNSRWSRFQDPAIEMSYTSIDDLNTYYTFKFISRITRPEGLNDNTPVWRVNIPIIADPSPDAQSCHSLAAGGTSSSLPIDPPVNAERPHEIIGFVRGVIYDTDIGNSPPNGEFPIVTNGEMPYNPPAGLKGKIINWGFFGDTPGMQCNTIRARLDCERFFLPSSDVSQESRTRLAF